MMPEAFVERMRQQLGEAGWLLFREAIAAEAPVSIRCHPVKWRGIVDEGLQAIPWASEGYYLPQRPVFTLDPAFQAGAYYVQEASSMFLGTVVRQLIGKRPVRVLDLCAAPGGKSTHLLAALSPDSLVVANEVIKSRYHILTHNLIKWGHSNLVTANHDSQDFAALEGFFDLVLVDAPCSGEGLFRKQPSATEEWSPEHVKHCAIRQRRILSNAARLVAPGGYLIYSTCTYNEQENQENVQWLRTETGLAPQTLSLRPEWGVEETPGGYQFYPHRSRGEGFFLSALRRMDGHAPSPPRRLRLRQVNKKQLVPTLKDWLHQAEGYHYYQTNDGSSIRAIPAQLWTDAATVCDQLPRSRIGLELGNFKRTDFVPSHALALSLSVADSLPIIDLPRAEAIRYMQREPFSSAQAVKGWTVVTSEGYKLGWVKGLENRINNYFPKSWRIRMEVGK